MRIERNTEVNNTQFKHSQFKKTNTSPLPRADSLNSGNDGCCFFTWISNLLSSLWDFLSCRKTATPKTETKQIFTPSVEISRPSPLPSDAPIGIRRTGNNCCINVILQGIANIPSWRAAVQNIPECLQALAAYDSAKQSGQRSIGTEFGTGLRNYLHRRDPIYGWNLGRQEDAQEILACLFANSSRAPRYEKIITIGLNEQRVEPYLFSTFYRGNLENTNSFDALLITSMYEQQRLVPYVTPPPEILVHNSIFYRDDEGNAYKVERPLEGNVLSVHLTPQLVSSGEEADYSCDYYAYHSGHSVNSGHYTCGYKVDGQWYRINDGHVEPITELAAVQEIRRAILIHYSRT